MTRFDGFILFAEMRTGSNYLEENINLFPGLQCHGEAFNPGFVGQHNWPDLFGMDRAARDSDPLALLDQIRTGTQGLGGFRFFHDHDRRILDAVVPDPRFAKIILTRNPLEAYVSRKIAAVTGQWRLTDEKHRKSARVRFDATEFEAHLQKLQAFQAYLQRELQVTGQAAFQISYDQVGDVEILNGLARFLGHDHQLQAVSTRLKRQNPAPLSDKVENHADMQAALARMNLQGMTQGVPAEARHEVAVPTFVAALEAPLLFMPIKGGPTEALSVWLAGLDGAKPDALRRDFTRKTLRQWKNQNKDARSFTVVSHPVARSYAVFERYILDTGPGSFARIRRALRDDFGAPFPDDGAALEADGRKVAFLAFLRFVKENLAGQTQLRTDPAWASQMGLLAGLSDVLTPDMVIRTDQLGLGLAQLSQQIARRQMPAVPDAAICAPTGLASIYDEEIEAAVRAVYNRDFMAFGFRRWRG